MKKLTFELRDSIRLHIKVGDIAKQKNTDNPIGILITHFTGVTGTVGQIETIAAEET